MSSLRGYGQTVMSLAFLITSLVIVATPAPARSTRWPQG